MYFPSSPQVFWFAVEGTAASSLDGTVGILRAHPGERRHQTSPPLHSVGRSPATAEAKEDT